MSERDALLAKAREGPSEEEIEARYTQQLERRKQVSALVQLTTYPEWKIFEAMVRREELDRWAEQLMDPQAVVTGVQRTTVTMQTPEGEMVEHPVTAPLDGQAQAMREQYLKGLVWGVRNVLSFPERAQKGLERALENERKAEEIRRLTQGHRPKPTVVNPAEGGS